MGGGLAVGEDGGVGEAGDGDGRDDGDGLWAVVDDAANVETYPVFRAEAHVFKFGHSCQAGGRAWGVTKAWIEQLIRGLLDRVTEEVGTCELFCFCRVYRDVSLNLSVRWKWMFEVVDDCASACAPVRIGGFSLAVAYNGVRVIQLRRRVDEDGDMGVGCRTCGDVALG